MQIREFLARWVWLCPLLGIVIAAAILWLFGLSLWSAILASLFLVCPAILAWGMWQGRHDP